MIHSRCYSRAHSSTDSQGGVAVVDDKNRRIEVRDKSLRQLPSFVINNRDILEHLILDGNNLTENAFNMPTFRRLRTLSIKRNKIRDISRLLGYVKQCCPRLESLSLTGNPGWPLLHKGLIDQRYLKFRSETERFLPRLLYLDSLPTMNEERCSSSLSNADSDILSIVTTDSDGL